MSKRLSPVKTWLSQGLVAGIAGILSATQCGAQEQLLADPASMLTTAERIDFVGRNHLSAESVEGARYLRSIPQRSATALYHAVDEVNAEAGLVRWTWRVDSLPKSADLRALQREDVGASIMFAFGEPSLFNRDVPTIAYTWTGTPVREGGVSASQRYGSLFYIKLRGVDHVGVLQAEERDLAADFRAVFGREPEPLRYVAVFNDNDQTGEPVSALFGPIFTRLVDGPLQAGRIQARP